MEWFFPTRVFRQMHGQGDGETGVDNEMAEQSFAGVGAWILGRNMFGPIRGPWPDDSWKGWWGDEPPYHTPVFVLTHHARATLRMAGGTEFRFVTEGIEAALAQARAAAGGQDVRVGGGVATIRQYLPRRPDRRAPPGHSPGPAGGGRASPGRHRSPVPGVRMREAGAGGARHPRLPAPAK